MNKSAFLKLIQQATNISDQQTDELEKMADAFPYCQTAHLLLAKSAYDKGSMLSTQRLRRAASYATDRQVLKQVIYSTPAEYILETVSEHEIADLSTALPDVSPTYVTEEIDSFEAENASDSEYPDPISYPEFQDAEGSDIPVISEILTENVSEEHLISSDTAEEIIEIPQAEAEPSAELIQDTSESELMSLLTISSLSPSFTDLLAQEPDPEPEISEAPELHEQSGDEITAESLATYIQSIEVNPTNQAQDEDQYDQPEAKIALEHNEEQEIQSPVNLEDHHPEDATIHYATDEIGRLFAEDALGYWMGSSRMGEQLQLKNEYTRPMPFSFHPELILEYNKTHELEKAIQPPANLLSQQLDIIEQFLKLNPRLKTMANLKMKEEPQEDLSLKSSKIKKSMASENLAHIFIRQGKIKKAIKIYEQLILKNPEKKTYFAEQIEKLQNQI